ncbi:DUF1345 domain-containing protein [Parvibaculum sp.]|uniref:DUF1345 domain-containing protein n=1 Tax=Parvibaculum sp. TaxID=2024848 RepID=UPI00320EA221
MSHRVVAHIRHHIRFYVSLLVGIAIWRFAGDALPRPLHVSIAADGAYALYLVLMFTNMVPLMPDLLRRRASYEDEGIGIIVVITVAAIVVSVGNIFVILNASEPPSTLHIVLALIGVLLGWLTLHVVMAAHYIQVYYHDALPGEGHKDTGGLDFPGTTEPTYWEFIYHSFVVGMTAQTSDTQVTSSRMRRITLGHGMLAFFYNTVLIALAVNIVVGLSK